RSTTRCPKPATPVGRPPCLCGASGDAPAGGPFGAVAAVRAGSYGVAEVAAQVWVHLLELTDGGPDAVGHRGPGPLHGPARRTGLVAHPHGRRQLVDEGVELDLALV